MLVRFLVLRSLLPIVGHEERQFLTEHQAKHHETHDRLLKCQPRTPRESMDVMLTAGVMTGHHTWLFHSKAFEKGARSPCFCALQHLFQRSHQEQFRKQSPRTQA